MAGDNQLFIFLQSDDAGNHFTPDHFIQFKKSNPETELVFLPDKAALIKALPDIRLIDTWVFDASWYSLAPNLLAVFTPAAGKNWVAEDPKGQVPTYYGKFHGPMIAETMLGLMMFFNRNMTAMLALQKQNIWDRNAQNGNRLLANQTALIIGYGNIGKACGGLLTKLGMRVLGHQRRHQHGQDPETGVTYVHHRHLDEALSEADHVIVLLPGDETTHYFMSRHRLGKMKPGAFLYNFGRGTTIKEMDLLWALDQKLIAGAGIDVTETEPLPTTSKLWQHENVVLLPHSACVFTEYQQLHIQELINLLKSPFHS